MNDKCACGNPVAFVNYYGRVDEGNLDSCRGVCANCVARDRERWRLEAEEEFDPAWFDRYEPLLIPCVGDEASVCMEAALYELAGLRCLYADRRAA